MPFLDVERNVEIRHAFFCKILGKRSVYVRPGFNREAITADAVERQRGLPAIVSHGLHDCAMPAALVIRAKDQFGGEQSMPLAHQIGFDLDDLANSRFGSVRALVNCRRDIADPDAAFLRSQPRSARLRSRRNNNGLLAQRSKKTRLAR